MPGHLTVAIVGADGAGKSTMARAVAARLAADDIPARLIDRWDLVGNPDYPTATFLGDDTRLVRSCAARMASTPRLLFLLWTSVMPLTDWVHPEPEGGVLVLDGHWMKHAASEIAYGQDRQWVEEVTAGLPSADLVIYLRSDPETAWRRKNGQALPYECAMDLSCSIESFRTHQGRIHALLDLWSARHGWSEVDATRPFDAVLADVAGHVRNALAPAAA